MTTLEKAIERFEKNAEFERRNYNLQGCLDFRQLAEWLKDYNRLLEQEPIRDIKEIAEIMKCGADAETKCKMISNILTAKPHYFAEQEPTEKPMTVDEMEREYEKSKALFHKIVECDDVVSRQAVINLIRGCNSALEEPRIFNCHNAGVKFEQYVTELPSVRPKEQTGHWIVHEKPHEIRYLECPFCNVWYLNEHLIRNSFCPNCGARMESEQNE